jgi:ABC-type lipoprotein export system ATPase subunit
VLSSQDGQPRVLGERLGHHYGDGTWLFRNVHLDLNVGGVTALIGPSGTGKSTLLAILAGVLDPAEGAVLWPGVDAITSIAQTAHGVPRRTVLDHIVLPYLAAGIPRLEAEERARPVAALFAIEHLLHAPYRQLSGGEAQRLMLARATARSSGLILADEPTANLDVRNARSVIDVLGGLAAGGAVVVVATHDPLARDACDEVIDLAATGRSSTGSEASPGSPRALPEGTE